MAELPTTCAGVTLKGNPCEKRVGTAGEFCHLHSSQKEASPPTPPRAAASSEKEGSTTCQGTTKQGVQCKKLASSGSYCYLHASREVPSRSSPEDRFFCAGITKAGNPCARYARQNSQFCPSHSVDEEEATFNAWRDEILRGVAAKGCRWPTPPSKKCTQPLHKDGYCSEHYAKWSATHCTFPVDGRRCGQAATSEGLCDLHHQSWSQQNQKRAERSGAGGSTQQQALRSFGLEGKVVTAAMVKSRYRELSLLHHPDRGGDPEKFKLLLQVKNQLLQYYS